MQPSRPLATLEPVRFGEFLLARHQITDEQWLAALAEHWSAAATGKHLKIGETIVNRGFLAASQVEAEARAFHDEIEVIEIADNAPRSERVTLELPVQKSGRNTPDRC
jgi:hypothetical protein